MVEAKVSRCRAQSPIDHLQLPQALLQHFDFFLISLRLMRLMWLLTD